jgi:hypothetical protein
VGGLDAIERRKLESSAGLIRVVLNYFDCLEYDRVRSMLSHSIATE